MKICRQGNGHYLNGLNNQDFYFMEGNLKLITDGCSEGKFSEVGTRLFVQQFSTLENRLDVNKFEKNVDKAFSKICSLYKNSSKEQYDFIVDNMLFTIIACFELDDKYVVKFIGDGYLVTVNSEDMVSYIRLSYGKTPPYYAYTKIATNTYKAPLEFKTFELSKKLFKKVGVASDGIAPIADRKINESFDSFILGAPSTYTPEGIIKSNQGSFYDDVTILI